MSWVGPDEIAEAEGLLQEIYALLEKKRENGVSNLGLGLAIWWMWIDLSGGEEEAKRAWRQFADSNFGEKDPTVS